MTKSGGDDALCEVRVATVAGWETHGISRSQLRTLARSGALVRTRHGVYATKPAMEKAAADPRLAHTLHVLSALLVVRGDAVASHHSAALIHGLEILNPPPADVVELTRSRDRNRAAYKNVVFHCGKLPPRHVMKRLRIPVTTIPRTVVDLGRTLPFVDAVVVADAACRAGLTKSEFEPVLDACVGWPGVERARRAIDFADPNAGSVFESCLRVFLQEWGFGKPETQVTIVAGGSSFSVDFMYREQRTIIETDGMFKYKDEKDLRKLYKRDQLLRDAGYKIVHVSWQEAFYQPQVVIDRIRKAFAASSPF